MFFYESGEIKNSMKDYYIFNKFELNNPGIHFNKRDMIAAMIKTKTTDIKPQKKARNIKRNKYVPGKRS